MPIVTARADACQIWRWLCGCAIAAALASGAAYGYSLFKDESGFYVIKWQSSPVAMQVRLSSATNLLDGRSQNSSVIAAMDAWNAQLGTVRFTPSTASPGEYSLGNGVNEVVLDDTVDGVAFPAGTLAMTIAYRQSPNGIAESDIVFNRAYTWDSYRGNVRNVEDIHRVAIHELGHVLGLAHPDDNGQSVQAIMNSQRSHIDRLQSDDIAGGRQLYGAPGMVAANDGFANAATIVLTADSARATGSNIAASRESGEPKHAGATSTHSVWWKWTATADSHVTVDTLGSDYDTVLAVYTGSTVSALTEVAANDDEESPEDNPTPQRKRTSKAVFDATAGRTYLIAVDGWGDEEDLSTGYTGMIVLNVSSVPLIPPEFTEQPVSQTVRAGTYVAFTVGVSGSPTPRLQWQRLPAGGTWTTLVDGNGFEGSTTVYLAVATTIAMAGDQYRCIATNGAGSVTSEPAKLNVTPIPLPVITTQPQSSVFQPDEPGELIVSAEGATSFQWYRNGVPLEGETAATFYVADPKAADAGEYRVEVINAGGSVQSQTVTVAVAVVPEVTNVGSLRQVVNVGQQASFNVSATGTGTLKYQWYHQGRAISGATASAYSRVVSVAADTGAYWVAVTDDVGTRNGAPFFVLLAHETTNVVGWGADTSPVSVSNGIGFGGTDNVGIIKQDGTVETRGIYMQSDLTDVVALAAYRYTSVALKADGTVTSFGGGIFGDSEGAPEGLKRVVAVASGERFNLALKTNGTVVSWGRFAMPTRELRDIVAISAAPAYALALKSDGTVVNLDIPGSGYALDTAVPAGLSGVVAIAAGGNHALALKANGTLVSWGENDHGQAQVPAGLNQVIAIAAGLRHSLALKADGTVVAWGRDVEGESTVPSGLKSVFAIATGYDASFALRDVNPGEAPLMVLQPVSQTTPSGYSVYMTVAAAAYPEANYEWRRNGASIPAATDGYLWITVTAAESGLYDVMVRSGDGRTRSEPAIVGVTTTDKVIGDGVELEPKDIRHPNGNIFDQVLLTGTAEAITADYLSGQITRTSFIDLDDDIVQVELSGPGTLSLVLDQAAVAAQPINYNQEINYVKGHAGIVITDADERTNVSVFTVGRATAFDPTGGYDLTKPIGATNDPARNGNPLFEGHAAEDYDGVADIAFIAISSANGKFGGVRTANAHYFAAKGHTGVYAPNVAFEGPVFIGNITAFDEAIPVIRLGAASDVRITGGDLFQDNGAAVRVSGINQLKFRPGSDSHGRGLPERANKAELIDGDKDVSAQIVNYSAP